MGQPAKAIDWTEGSGAFRVIDRSASTLPPAEEPLAPRVESAVVLRSPLALDLDEDDGDDEPTRTYVRESVLPAPDPIADLDRATGCAVVRLGALLDWIAEEEGASGVADFVHSFLAYVGRVSQALDRFGTALRGCPSEALRPTGEAFLRAAALWRANLVDHVDELALTHHRSFDGWSSLPEYSAMYILAFVMPSLDSVKQWTIASRSEGAGIGAEVGEAEDAIIELNWMLRQVDDGRVAMR